MRLSSVVFSRILLPLGFPVGFTQGLPLSVLAANLSRVSSWLSGLDEHVNVKSVKFDVEESMKARGCGGIALLFLTSEVDGVDA